MPNWFDYLKQGFSRQMPVDGLSSRQAPSGEVRANLRRLMPFVTRHWRKGVVGAGLLLLNSALAFPQPLITRYLIDDVILGRRLDLLLGVIVLLVGVSLSGMLIGAVQSYYFTRFEQEVILDIQQDLLNRTLHLPKSFFDEKEVGYLMARLSSDVMGLRWFFSSTIVNIASNFLRLIGGIGLLFYLEWRFALVALIVIPGLIVWARFFSRRVRALSHQTMERQAQVSRRMQESLSSASLIKAFAAEERETRRVMDELRAVQQISLEQMAVGSVAGMSLNALQSAANLVVLIGGAYWAIIGQWTLGSLMAFRSYVGYVYGPAQFLANINLQLQGALAALERISALYEIVPEESGAGIPVERLRGAVEFREVSFAYASNQPVLSQVSCQIGAGEQVAIVGPSGVGKTTLISLLLRFYQPASGEIWFDGRPAADYELGSLRRRIGYVSQDTLLLSGSILENLRYGNPAASLEEVAQAARIAGIHDFIAGLPEGYDSPVGEKGVNLSEGQKQRLSIARALVKSPDILILDEPTSALDSITEKSIWELLPASVRGKTLFVVAHRLSTAQNADRILLLNENRLVAVGTHHSLLAENEFYRTLVANQQIIT